MTRREFICNVFGAMCGVAINQILEPFGTAAAWRNPIQTNDDTLAGVQIAETNLAFGKLDLRPATNAFVIHHIGNTDADVCAADVHKWHLARGWSGIGYHFLIRKDGTIERGRPLAAAGAHCLGQNDHTLGINLVGNFEVSSPTSAQLDSASALLAALCLLYDISPSPFTIRGHRDYNDTCCPGYYLYNELSQLFLAAEKNVGRMHRIDERDTEPGDLPPTPGTARKKYAEAKKDSLQTLPGSVSVETKPAPAVGTIKHENIRPVHRFGAAKK